MGFAAYLAFGTLLAFGRKIKFGKPGALKLMRAQPGSTYGFLLAHLGLAICMAGITAMSVWATEDAQVLKLGESMEVGGYEFTLENLEPGQSANYQKIIASVRVNKAGKKAQVALLKSERRFYPCARNDHHRGGHTGAAYA